MLIYLLLMLYICIIYFDYKCPKKEKTKKHLISRRK